MSPDYGRTEQDYLRIGREQTDMMRHLLSSHGCSLPSNSRILDFGCAAGRMTRWLLPETTANAVIGVDVDAASVYWCQQHLSPPFTFLTSTLQPHLPFRDDTFGLVFSGSVFTHIEDLADAWLAELARVLAPGGYAYLTIHDEATCAQLEGPWRTSHFARTRTALPAYREFASRPYCRFTIGRGIASQVFYTREWWRKMAAPWFEVMDFHEAAYLYQTAVVMRAR
ncbi:class I SAM-dependent methyltransferase [Congregicoccus parvus]|uniref:class I SAM-dependent methyltransferase n=1 Tax=Congregicoccus parvus TaxID=3081749 RepID=UPI003FA5CE81